MNDDDGLRWVGNVGTGFTEKTLDELLGTARPLERPDSPLVEVPKMPRVRKSDVVWVEPKLVAEVEFAEWTHDGHLRAPAFHGLRDDKRADEVRRERARTSRAEIRKGKRVLKLSNLDKLFWPEEGITKGDLLAYYRDVAPVLVPAPEGPPFTMKRYPDGWQGSRFFQKDAPKHMPEWIPTATVRVSTREQPRQKRRITLPLVNDELALLWMVNMGCIDMNTWYSRVDRPDRPGLRALRPRPVARRRASRRRSRSRCSSRQVLDALGLRASRRRAARTASTCSSRSSAARRYDDTREFAEIVAGALARTHRGLVTTEWTKAKRRGVLIDANQNGEGKTIASVYSVRPQPGRAGVDAAALGRGREALDPAAFTMDVALERIARHGDLFEGVLTEKQSLSKALAAVR